MEVFRRFSLLPGSCWKRNCLSSALCDAVGSVSGLNSVSLSTHVNKDIREGLKLRGLCYPTCVLCLGRVYEVFT